MKFNLSNQDLEQLQALFLRKEKNMEVATIYNTFLDKQDQKSSQAAFYLQSERGHSPSEAFTKVFLKVSPVKDASLLKNYSLEEAKELDPTPFEKDFYYQTIHFPEEKLGEWELLNAAYLPYEGFVYDELEVEPSKGYLEKTPFGFFSRGFPYLAVKQKGITWMSLTPHEINTMKSQVAAAHGEVLTLGLGLGYYAFMASEKEDVTSISVLEYDPTIIKLFEQYILPQFPHKEKVHIIQGDAFKYVKGLKDGTFDYLFADIWHLPTDGLYMYLPLKHSLKNLCKTEVSYWIETSILTLLRRALLILMEEEVNGSSDEDYDYAANESDLLINRLHRLLKKKELNSYQDVMDLLADDSLKNLPL